MSKLATEKPQEAEEVKQEAENQPKVFDLKPEVKEDDFDEELPKFDSKEELEDYTKVILKKKRQGFNEAKTYREQFEEANYKLGELEKKMAEQEQSSVQASEYQKQIEELMKRQEEQANLLAQYQQEVEAQRVRQAELQFNHAAEKHGIEEREFLKFKWHEHLKNLPQDQQPNLDTFVLEMREKHPSVFSKPNQNTAPATSGLSPVAQSSEQVTVNSVKGEISRTPADRMKLESEWEAYKRQNGLV